METHGIAALSELAESFRGNEERRITRKDFEAALRRHLNDSHSYQLITQIWNKVSLSYDVYVGRLTSLTEDV
jgi:hypothetical protein